MTWVYLTLLAVSMQAVRYAAQKQLATHLSVDFVSWVRFAFGLPFAILFYLVFVKDIFLLTQLSNKYIWMVLIIGVSQLLATVCAVLLLGRHNFAVGTALIKTEAIFTPLFGLLFFAEFLSPLAWMAVAVVVAGLTVASVSKFNASITQIIRSIDTTSVLLGLSGGALFAVSSVFIRQANMQLDNILAPISQAVMTLVLVLFVQTVLGGFYLVFKNRGILTQINTHWKSCLFIGLTSMLGSFGWFAAFSLQNAAYVKTLGQIELLLTLLITNLYFKETIKFSEYIAMLLILTSAFLIVWA